MIDEIFRCGEVFIVSTFFFDRQRDLWTSERNAIVGRGAWGIEIEMFRSVKTREIQGNMGISSYRFKSFIFFMFVPL